MSPATPAAASRWPRFVFTEPIAQRAPDGRPSLRTADRERSSIGSPSGVPVPWASTYATSEGRRRAFASEGSKLDGRWRIHARVIGIVMAEGEPRPVAIGAGTCVEERRSATIDLAGAVVTRTTRVHEGEAARGVDNNEFLRATHDTDAPAEEGI